MTITDEEMTTVTSQVIPVAKVREMILMSTFISGEFILMWLGSAIMTTARKTSHFYVDNARVRYSATSVYTNVTQLHIGFAVWLIAAISAALTLGALLKMLKKLNWLRD